MSLIFLSHAHKDKETIDLINQRLILSGIPTWYDSNSLNNGDSLHGKIVEGISNAKVFCLFYSTHAAVSGNVRFEIEHAIKRKVSDPSFQVRLYLIDDIGIPPELKIWVYKRLSNVTNKISFIIDDLKGCFNMVNLPSHHKNYSLRTDAMGIAHEITGGNVYGSYFIDEESSLLLFLKESSKEVSAYELSICKKLGHRFLPKYTFSNQGRVEKFGIDLVEGRSVLSISSWEGGNGMGEHFFSLIDLNTFEEFTYREGRLYAYYEGPISPLVRLGDGLFISDQSFFELAQKYDFFEKTGPDRKNWFYANSIWLARNNDKSNFGRIEFIPFESGLESDLETRLKGDGCEWFMWERGPIVHLDDKTGRRYIAIATASRYNKFDRLKKIKDGISFTVDDQKYDLLLEGEKWKLIEILNDSQSSKTRS